MWPFTIGTFYLFGFFIRASFVMMVLSTDEALSFGPTSFGRMSESLAVIALLYRNGSTKFTSVKEGIWNFRPKGDGRSGP